MVILDHSVRLSLLTSTPFDRSDLDSDAHLTPSEGNEFSVVGRRTVGIFQMSNQRWNEAQLSSLGNDKPWSCFFIYNALVSRNLA